MYSILLVTVQFTLIAGIVQYCSFPYHNVWLTSVGIAGAAIGLIAIAEMGPRNLQIRPVPKTDALFVTTGIYRYIRHPMYSSVLTVMLPFVIHTSDKVSLLMFAALAGTLYAKMVYEERLLERKFPEYSEYKQRTYRLVPFIY